MTNRYKPNEVAAPIDLGILALLLRSNDERAQSIIGLLKPLERARLAVFCVGRCHMRKLGLDIAAQCDEQSLWQVAGPLGATIYDQACDAENFDRGPTVYNKKPVTLARQAA